jgi:formylmethanofuran dehydrogenase subunit A
MIKNGILYDPANSMNGEKVDICIKDGKVVEKVNLKKAEIIDASDMLVMPGGVDIHSHIAGPKVNAGRLLCPEDHRTRARCAKCFFRNCEIKTPVTRSGTGCAVPSIFTTGHIYSAMGYTTVIEPASPPLKTLHTHEELNDIPLIDKACFLLFGNNWIVMEYLKEGRIEECAAYVGWVLRSVKGYAIKIVCPGGVESWGWGGNVHSMDDHVPNFNVTPRDIVRGLCKVNQLLNLPHTIHVHAINLGTPGNYRYLIETMDSVRDLQVEDEPVIHMTHCQFNSYGGVDWRSLSSKADEVAKYVNSHNHVTIDMGQIIFTQTVTMTGDGPFEYLLHQISGNKWMNTDLEVESGGGLVPIRYNRKNYVHAVMWTIGLELALLVEDPWRVFFSTDHPNGGPFINYPKVFAWLMSKKARDKVAKKLPRLARVRSNITSIDREYDFYELAIITRAATAKALKLQSKGHLGLGADADVSIYDLNPKEVDPSTDYKRVRKSLSKTAYTIKGGEIVAQRGIVKKCKSGTTYWVNPKVTDEVNSSIMPELTEKFRDYYTINLKNYGVPENYLVNQYSIETKSNI